MTGGLSSCRLRQLSDSFTVKVFEAPFGVLAHQVQDRGSCPLESTGCWPQGLLDAYIAMIPKADGDATPLGQRPLSVLPVVYRLWLPSGLGI